MADTVLFVCDLLLVLTIVVPIVGLWSTELHNIICANTQHIISPCYFFRFFPIQCIAFAYVSCIFKRANERYVVSHAIMS